MKDFEEKVIEAIKNAIDEIGPGLFDDITKDNPEWYTEKLKEVFCKEITKALKNKKLIKEVVLEILSEQVDFEAIVEEQVKNQIPVDMIVKLIKEKL